MSFRPRTTSGRAVFKLDRSRQLCLHAILGSDPETDPISFDAHNWNTGRVVLCDAPSLTDREANNLIVTEDTYHKMMDLQTPETCMTHPDTRRAIQHAYVLDRAGHPTEIPSHPMQRHRYRGPLANNRHNMMGVFDRRQHDPRIDLRPVAADYAHQMRVWQVSTAPLWLYPPLAPLMPHHPNNAGGRRGQRGQRVRACPR